jgi:hypothetical protein
LPLPLSCEVLESAGVGDSEGAVVGALCPATSGSDVVIAGGIAVLVGSGSCEDCVGTSSGSEELCLGFGTLMLVIAVSLETGPVEDCVGIEI